MQWPSNTPFASGTGGIINYFDGKPSCHCGSATFELRITSSRQPLPGAESISTRPLYELGPALRDVGEPDTASAAICGSNPRPIVLYLQNDLTILFLRFVQLDNHRTGLGMFQNIIELFLDDTVNGYFLLRGKTAFFGSPEICRRIFIFLTVCMLRMSSLIDWINPRSLSVGVISSLDNFLISSIAMEIFLRLLGQQFDPWILRSLRSPRPGIISK